MGARIRSLLTLLLCLFAVPAAHAQDPDLTGLSLEELMSLEITSASRKQQRIDSVAGAVYVLTGDDIRRSGMTNLPEVFRLVPGMNVAQVNGNKWAVSIRGFNGLYAATLLVLVDGRPAYNRLFGGVMWDIEDVVLDEIERIEIVRGPGGAMWGTNAVNGVINIVTRGAASGRETTVRLGSTSFDGDSASLTHGGSARGTDFRFVSRWSGGRSSRLNGEPAGDEGASWRVGAKAERRSDSGSISIDGHYRTGWYEPLWTLPVLQPAPPQLLPGRSDFGSGAVTMRGTRTLSAATTMQLQTSGETTTLDVQGGHYLHRAADVDAQLRHATGRHDVIVGAAYRLLHESLHRLGAVTLEPAHSDETMFSAFVQDEIRLSRTVTATVAARAEKDTGFGWQVQPTARALWTVSPKQTIWGAVSRAVRIPSLQERGIEVTFLPIDVGAGLPVSTVVSGNPTLRPETVVTTEAGYRARSGRFEFDVAAFVSRYRRLRSSEPGVPDVRLGPAGPYLLQPLRFASLFGADTRGLEGWMRVRLPHAWRLDTGLTLFAVDPRPDPGSLDDRRHAFDAAAPQAQAFVRSGWTTGRHDVDLFVSRIQSVESSGIPAYTRLDIRYEHRLNARLSVVFAGQNLLRAEHVEAKSTDALILPTAIPRSAGVHLRWRLR